MMESTEQKSLKIVSWNTRGIKNTKRTNSKLELVLNELIQLKADVVFLQETHIGLESNKFLEDITGWRSYFTVHSDSSKGVAILINKETKFSYLCHDEDYSGGYIVLFCRFYDQLFTLVNVYNHKADRDMLDRLRTYLTAINTKGVLVVGGDFNIVLEPAFDRRSSANRTYQSPLRGILETFSESLSLKDVFALMHPREEGFTRSQGESHSRLDMFFMPKNIMNYVTECKMVKSTMRKSTTGDKRISDHEPVILDLSFPLLFENKIPEVASMLEEFKYDGDPDRREKINGAEILSAIRCLPDSQDQTPDELSVYDYKKNDLPMTEILKRKYNLMLKSNSVPECFSESLLSSNGTHIFNIDYLIFVHILAKRLKVFITSSSSKGETKKQSVHSQRIIVTFEKCPQEIKMVFLKQSLSSLMPPQSNTHAPPHDFSILENLLLKSRQPTDGLRNLHQDCPLTTPILTLVLKQLGKKITNKRKSSCNFSVCNFRQSLLIHTDNQNTEKIFKELRNFKIYSGLRIQF